MCKLLIHPGDTYISCIINRNNKAECYYEGIGTVGEILSTDDTMFYAKLENFRRFENKVPITLTDGKFVEHLGRENTSLNPFTSPRSVRVLKNEAYDYILCAGGRQMPIECLSITDCSRLEDLLKNSIRSYFVGQTLPSMFHIERISRRLSKALSISSPDAAETDFYFYKPSNNDQVLDSSLLIIEKELNQAKSNLKAEKDRREEVERTLQSVKEQTSKNIDRLKAELSQAECLRQELLLQRQQIEEQLRDSQESSLLIGNSLSDAKLEISKLKSQLESILNQRSSLQTELDTSISRIEDLERMLVNLESQYMAEKLLREQLEAVRLDLEEKLGQVEDLRFSENESNMALIVELKNQLKLAENQSGLLQTSLDQAVSQVSHLSIQTEKTAQSEQMLLTKIEDLSAENDSLREQIIDGEAQQKALKVALSKATTYIKNLTEEYSNLEHQFDAEVLVRTQLEAELNVRIEQRQHLEEKHAAEKNQSRIEIEGLKRKNRALKQRIEQLEQDLQTSEYRSLGVCRHCGGAFSGFLRKKCSSCGRAKDY